MTDNPFETKIAVPKRFELVDLAELWEYRELIFFLGWQSIASRYKDAMLGVAWALLQPVVTVVTLTYVAGKFVKFPAGDVPYPVFLFCGMVAWGFVSAVVLGTTGQAYTLGRLLSKVYFPRITIPIALTISPLLDTGVAALALVALLIFYRIPLTPNLLLLPVFICLTYFVALSASFLVSAFALRFRDFRHLVPLLVQGWFFLSPVMYVAEGKYPAWLNLVNPLWTALNGIRWCVLNQGEFPATTALAFATVLLGVVGGALMFQNLSRPIVDNL